VKRLIVTLLALTFLAPPPAVEAQESGKVYRIGWLGFGSPTTLLPLAEPFRRRLHPNDSLPSCPSWSGSRWISS